MTKLPDSHLDDALSQVEAHATLAELEKLIGVTAIRRTIATIEVHGRGGKAFVKIRLDNGDLIELDPLGSFSTPQKMNFELSAQGAEPSLGTGEPQKVARLLHRLGAHYEVSQTADRAWELGEKYLAKPTTVTCDARMSDQASRWSAFYRIQRESQKDIVIFDHDTDSYYVRTFKLIAFLRAHSDAGEALRLKAELERTCKWRRPGNEGRVKATRPNFPGQTLQWAFLIVPLGWKDQR